VTKRKANTPLHPTASPPQRLKLMWDYDAFPLWTVPGPMGWQGMVPPERLPISTPLRDELQEWSDQLSAAMWGTHGPDSKKSKPPSETAIAAFDARGRELLRRLREELGDRFVVGYQSEITHQVEWPERT
jgi:hypothetical protein